MSRVAQSSGASAWAERILAVGAGLFVGLSILKLGSPCILGPLVPPPISFEEWRIAMWPPRYGYLPLVLLCAGSLLVVRLAPRPRLPWVLPPLIWFGWQGLSALATTSPRLTALTLPHFAGCLACYLVGLFALGRIGDWRWFAAPLVMAFLLMLRAGIQQHFGGLSGTREFISLYYATDTLPEELVKRMNTGRIFATMFYPNAFAGALILLLPFAMASVWELTRVLRTPSRALVTGIVAVAGLACLVWSGSKAGWLIMLAMGIQLGWRVGNVRARWKLAAVGVILVIGLATFGVRYAGFFRKGATSVVARFDYWQAAARIFVAHPILGVGPGAFQANYLLIKRPEAEMAKLVHNDYLQQACDSGGIGAIAYVIWICAILRVAIRQTNRSNWLMGSLAIGVMGWFAQGLVEFGLYIPGLAWPGFLLAGSVVGASLNPVDNAEAGR